MKERSHFQSASCRKCKHPYVLYRLGEDMFLSAPDEELLLQKGIIKVTKKRKLRYGL